MKPVSITRKASKSVTLLLVGGLLGVACGGGADGGKPSDDCPEGDASCEGEDPCEATHEACLDDAANILGICWDGLQVGMHNGCTAAGADVGCTLRFDEAADICRDSYEECAPPEEIDAESEAYLALRNCTTACSEAAYDCYYAAHDAGCTPSGIADCDASFEDCTNACRGEVNTCGDGVVQSDEACDAGEAGDLGCQDCSVVFSYLCSGAPSVCRKTGLDENLLLSTASEEEATTFCEWFIGILGGEGSQRVCGVDDVVYTTRSVSSCVATIRSRTGRCTVGDLETWAGEPTGPCGLSLSADPDCVANDPDATIADAGDEEDPTPTPVYTEETAAECFRWNGQTDDCSLCMATAGCDALGRCSVDGDACTSCWEAGDPSACRELSTITDLRRYALAFCDVECHDEKNLCDISDSQDSCTTCLEESCCVEFAECANSACSACWEDGDCFSYDSAFEEMHACATSHCDGCVPDPLL